MFEDELLATLPSFEDELLVTQMELQATKSKFQAQYSNARNVAAELIRAKVTITELTGYMATAE